MGVRKCLSNVEKVVCISGYPIKFAAKVKDFQTGCLFLFS